MHLLLADVAIHFRYKMVKIASWNVNSVKARLPHVIDWLRDESIDIALLQETKCLEEAFPFMELEDLGYNIAVAGQKTYNGVAILSKFPIEDVVKALPGDEKDEEARYIEGVISSPEGVLRVASVYVPNGTEVGSDRFAYKLKFFDRLREHAKNLLELDEKLVIGGDYNVAPTDIDVFDAKTLRGTLCFHPDEQEKFRSLEYIGLTDVFRAKYPEKMQFSWWDYRGGGYQHNKGMRIDHLMLSPLATDSLEACDVDENPRKKDKPSDHTPIWCSLAA